MDENHQDNAESKLAAIEDTKWVLNAKNALLIPRHLLIPKHKSEWPTTPAQWIELLGTPLTILITALGLLWGVYQFNTQQLVTAQMQATQEAANAAQALDQQRQTTLDTYLDRMQELFIAKPDSFKAYKPGDKAYKPGDEYQALAEARTSTALRHLDGMRKAILIRFLWKAKLINGPHPIVSLNSANLLGANFNSADLSGANLSGAWLNCGELERGKEGCTDLSYANLGCNLSGGIKVCADLRGAYLMGAKMNNNTYFVAHTP